MAFGPKIFMINIEGIKKGSIVRYYFLGLQSHCRWLLLPWFWKTLTPWKKSYDTLNSVLKIKDILCRQRSLLLKLWFFLQSCMDLRVGPEIRLLLFSHSLVCDSLGPPWAAACQASLSFVITQSLLNLMSIKSVMPSNNLILLTPSPPALNLCQHQTLFQWVSSSQQVFKILKLQLQHQPFQWIFRVDVFRIDWFNLLAVQGTLKSLLQCHSSKPSILWFSAIFLLFASHIHTWLLEKP